MLTTSPTRSQEGAQIRCEGIWKVFGDGERAAARALAASGALTSSEAGVAVEDVSFQVDPAETLVIMGLSGSGKSTLIRCLTRLIEPTAGNVFFNDQCVTSMKPAQLRDFHRHECAMVFQHFGLFPHRRVIDNVAFGLEVRGVARAAREERAREVLELVGLAHRAQHFPHELSGGMKQRVGLARALAVEPRLLLFDEPFSALDPLIRRDLQDELLRLRKSVHKTMLFITHDMQEALRLGDRIAIMRDGKFVQIGTPEQIVLSPADEYVQRFVRDTPRGQILRAGTLAAAKRTLLASTSPEEALTFFAHEGRTDVVAVDGEGRPLGMLTAEKVRVAAERGVADLTAELDPVTVSVQGDAVDEVARKLASGQPAAVVVDASGRYEGELDATTVLQALVGSTEITANQRTSGPTGEAPPGSAATDADTKVTVA